MGNPTTHLIGSVDRNINSNLKPGMAAPGAKHSMNGSPMPISSHPPAVIAYGPKAK